MAAATYSVGTEVVATIELPVEVAAIVAGVPEHAASLLLNLTLPDGSTEFQWVATRNVRTMPVSSPICQRRRKAHSSPCQHRLEAHSTPELPATIQEAVKLASAAEKRAADESKTGAADSEWTVSRWLGDRVAEPVGACLLRPLGDAANSPQSALAFVTHLTNRDDVLCLLRTPELIDRLADVVWSAVSELQRDEAAASGSALQDKFSGAIVGSYGGIESFFGGLEAQVGAPHPQPLVGMRLEHTDRPESNQLFTTANYGVETTSRCEWAFVSADDDQPGATLGFDRWPEESETKLPDRSRCRKRRPLSSLLAAAEEQNQKLAAQGEPRLLEPEVVGATLYTGPVFVKYNGVLRGLACEDSAFLRNTMVTLCCGQKVADAYMGGATIFEPAAGKLSFDEARKAVNKYTSTLHAINSCIIKLGKMTYAAPVYRGMSGMALPPSFWKPNEHGVRGGVEPAFMSTTSDRQVAMHYAAKGSVGVVFEIRQGMIARGADLQWLSQYPYEAEVLFGPLAGLEVIRARVAGSVVVFEMSLSINLSALTLEQVIGKRLKLLDDMAKNLAIEVRGALSTTEFATVGEQMFSRGLLASDGALDEAQLPEHYNDDAAFVEATSGVLKWKAALLDDEKRLAHVPSLLRPAERVPCLGELVKAATANADHLGVVRGMAADRVSPQLLRAKGATASVLHAAGYSVDEARGAGVTLHEIRTGWSDSELRASGVSACQLREAGATPMALRLGGFRRGALLDAGWSAAELAAAGAAGARVLSFDTLVEGVLSLCQLRDGRGLTQLALGCADGTLRIHARTGELLRVFHGHSSLVWAVCAISVGESGEAPLLASASEDGTLRLWDVAMGEGTPMRTLEGHSDAVLAVCDAGGGVLASGSGDTTVRLWSGSQTLAHTLRGHDGAVFAVCALPTGGVGGAGSALASGSEDGEVRVWNVHDGTLLRTLRASGESGGGAVFTLCALANERLVSGGADGTLRVWQADTCVATLAGHDDAVLAVCSLGASEIASGGKDGRVLLWDLESGAAEPRKVLTAHPGGNGVFAICELAATGHVASAGGDANVQIWDGDEPETSSTDTKTDVAAPPEQSSASEATPSSPATPSPPTREHAQAAPPVTRRTKPLAGKHPVFGYESLVFACHGATAMIYPGVLRALEDAGVRPHLKRFAGAAAGAVVAALVALGLTSEQLYHELADLLPLLPGGKALAVGAPVAGAAGIDDPLRARLSELIALSLGSADATFRSLYELAGIELAVPVVNVTSASVCICHMKTTPELPLREALCRSVAAPTVLALSNDIERELKQWGPGSTSRSDADRGDASGELRLNLLRRVKPDAYGHEQHADVVVDGGLCHYPINVFDGWWLSMAKQDSFAVRLIGEGGHSNFVERFAELNESTFGFRVFSTAEPDALHQRLGNDSLALKARASMEIAPPDTRLAKLYESSRAAGTAQMKARLHNERRDRAAASWFKIAHAQWADDDAFSRSKLPALLRRSSGTLHELVSFVAPPPEWLELLSFGTVDELVKAIGPAFDAIGRDVSRTTHEVLSASAQRMERLRQQFCAILSELSFSSPLMAHLTRTTVDKFHKFKTAPVCSASDVQQRLLVTQLNLIDERIMTKENYSRTLCLDLEYISSKDTELEEGDMQRLWHRGFLQVKLWLDRRSEKAMYKKGKEQKQALVRRAAKLAAIWK